MDLFGHAVTVRSIDERLIGRIVPHHKLSMDEPIGHCGMVPVWDRLFGAWRGTPEPDVAICVLRPYRKGYWVITDLLRDYNELFRGLICRPAELSPGLHP